MGDDGHTASLFPRSPNLHNALNPSAAAGCIGMRAPTEPHARLSLNLAALLDSRRMYILILGEAKLAYLHRGKRRRARRGHAGARGAAPGPHARRGGLGTMREPEDERTALDKEAIKNAFLDDLFYMQGKIPALATGTTTTWRSPTPCATGCCIAGSAPPRPTPSKARAPSPILSAEFLMGPHLGNNLLNLGISTRCAQG